MAKETGLHSTQVSRIWRAHGLKPHRVKAFKLSRDPRFVEKLRDVVGLYLAPPERAIVLSFDEKIQVQALDRTSSANPCRGEPGERPSPRHTSTSASQPPSSPSQGSA